MIGQKAYFCDMLHRCDKARDSFDLTIVICGNKGDADFDLLPDGIKIKKVVKDDPIAFPRTCDMHILIDRLDIIKENVGIRDDLM